MGINPKQPTIPTGIFKINTSAFEQLYGFFFSRKNPRGRLADFRVAHPDITAIKEKILAGFSQINFSASS